MSEPAMEPAASSTLMTDPVQTTEPAAPTAESPKEPDAPKEPEGAKPLTVEDFKAPEGMELDKAATEGFVKMANELGLPPEGAQKLFAYGSEMLSKAQSASMEAFVKQNESWVEECKADKEFGGEKLESNLASISKLIDNPKFADPGLRQALNFTGAGNNPAIFRTFARMAQALTEGGQVAGGPAKVDRPTTFGEALYGKQGN